MEKGIKKYPETSETGGTGGARISVNHTKNQKIPGSGAAHRKGQAGV